MPHDSRPARSRTLAVLLSAVLLVGAANVAAYAASGDPLLSGKGNSATKTTKLKNTGSGPALKLRSAPGTPSFAVSSNARVPRLNADLVDGHHVEDLMTPTFRYELTTPLSSGASWGFADLPPGVYEASFSVFATMASAGTVIACGFQHADGTYDSATYGTFSSSSSSVNATVLLDLRVDPVLLTCFGGSDFTITDAATGNIASSVSLVRVSDVTGAAASMRPTHRAPRFGR